MPRDLPGVRVKGHQLIMSEEETNEESPEEDLEDEEFEEPELGDDIDEDDDLDPLVGDDEETDFVDEVVEDEAVVAVPPKPAGKGAAKRDRPGDDKEDEDEDELDPDDVEADLDTILKDRLEAYDESDDDEEEESPVISTEEGDLPQKREGEFPCPSCFLLVNSKQVSRTGYCPHCGDPIAVPATLR